MTIGRSMGLRGGAFVHVLYEPARVRRQSAEAWVCEAGSLRLHDTQASYVGAHGGGGDEAKHELARRGVFTRLSAQAHAPPR